MGASSAGRARIALFGLAGTVLAAWALAASGGGKSAEAGLGRDRFPAGLGLALGRPAILVELPVCALAIGGQEGHSGVYFETHYPDCIMTPPNL